MRVRGERSAKEPGRIGQALAGIALLILGCGGFGAADAAALALPALPAPAQSGGALPQLPQSLTPSPTTLPSGAFPVPPVVERPLNANTGPRVFVKKFVLEGVRELPAEGITKAKLETLIEKLRVKREGLNRVGGDGFTAKERAQITAFMSKVVSNPDQDMLLARYQALVDKLRAQRSRRLAGLTVGQMQEIANAVTEYYRSRGLILAQAYIPAQEVAKGVVRVQVEDGTLGRVIAEGNKRYASSVLERPFAAMVGKPVTSNAIESDILTVNDYPGVNAFGVLQPGEETGTTDLLLRVQQEKPFAATARIDNGGTQYTGKYRMSGTFTWNNPTGLGDQLTAQVLQQFDPKNALYGSLAYQLPIGSPANLFGASVSRNPYNLGASLASLDIKSTTTQAQLFGQHTFLRSRQRNIYGRLAWDRMNAKTSLRGRTVTIDNLSAVDASVRFDSIDTTSRAINQGAIHFVRGLGGIFGGMKSSDAATRTVPSSREGADRKFATNNFWKVKVNYARLQTLTSNQTLLVRVEGQYSSSLLTSLEQFSLGGPDSVRAYPSSEYLADTALFTSVEWNLNAPALLGFGDKAAFDGFTWGQILRFSLFGDWGWGKLNHATQSEAADVSLLGVGTGLQLTLPGKFTGRFQVAHALGTGVVTPTNPSGNPSNGQSTEYWFDFTYHF